MRVPYFLTGPEQTPALKGDVVKKNCDHLFNYKDEKYGVYKANFIINTGPE